MTLAVLSAPSSEHANGFITADMVLDGEENSNVPCASARTFCKLAEYQILIASLSVGYNRVSDLLSIR